MPDVPLNFFWEIPKAGHRWIQTHAMDQAPDLRWTYLTPAHSTGSQRVLGLRYHPLAAHSGLFRNFAATEPEPGRDQGLRRPLRHARRQPAQADRAPRPGP